MYNWLCKSDIEKYHESNELSRIFTTQTLSVDTNDETEDKNDDIKQYNE